MSSPGENSTPPHVQDLDLDYLVSVFASNVFTSNTTDPKEVQIFDDIQEKCVKLFNKDYIVKIIDNDRGELSATYPNKIVSLALPAHSDGNWDGGNGHQEDAQELRMHMKKSRVARARTRFVVPVILYDGKHICRSATLSGGIEMYTRTLVDYLCGPSRCRFSQFCVSSGLVDPHCYGRPSTSRLREEYEELPGDADTSHLPEDDASLHDELRKEDIELLRLLSVDQICDFMVEGKKKKCGIKITSSEKVDRSKRYQDFTIFKLPYPGCEFFEKYVKQHYNPEGLFYDWTQHFVDVELDVPETSVASELNIDWKNYKRWDLVELTKNYLKFLLKVIIDGDSSILVHCISGWDRTALFVSLLRLSLWADNAIHQNLSALEMAYLTAAYDWFLFSHRLPRRVQKFEEIFFFCFNMLKYISAEEFSTLNLKSHGNRSSKIAGTSSASERESLDANISCLGLYVPEAETTTMVREMQTMDTTDAGPSARRHVDTSHDATPESTSSSDISIASREFPALVEHHRQCYSHSDKACEEAPFDVEEASVEGISLSVMLSQPPTETLMDIQESWQVFKETGSTDSSLSLEDNGDPNTSCSSLAGSSENSEKPGGSEDGTPSEKELSLKLRRERLEEVRLLVTRAYLNMRTAAANQQASPRYITAIARTFSVGSARDSKS